MKELEPCPFCGGTKFGNSVSYWSDKLGGGTRHQVRCSDCGAEGPCTERMQDFGEAELLSQTLWNERGAGHSPAYNEVVTRLRARNQQLEERCKLLSEQNALNPGQPSYQAHAVHDGANAKVEVNGTYISGRTIWDWAAEWDKENKGASATATLGVVAGALMWLYWLMFAQ